MERQVSQTLLDWLDAPHRRPLVLRGARQVGKTWLARRLAEQADRDLVELNFERDPQLAGAFSSNDPVAILDELALVLNRGVTPERSLLFLDEIQAAGELLAKLRWFHEEMPALPVIAAGSLLEFTLADHAFSMPVGRIGFRHVEPLGFPEYLEAHGQERLLGRLAAWRPGTELSPTAHALASDWWRRYAMVGGMPAVVAADVAGEAPSTCRELQAELVATYRADFAKYSGRMDRSILDVVLMGIAASVGRKFVYARAGDGIKQQQAKRSFELLAAARLCHVVRHSAANGLPLAAEAKDSFRKAIMVDVGLLHAILRTPAAAAFPPPESLAPDLRSRMAEQLAGQQLRLLQSDAGDGPELFYWQREGGRPGEIDYLIDLDARIIPIELKSGAAGSMKSLHQFMHDKHLDLAVRCDTNPPSAQRVEVKTTQGQLVAYELLSVPLFLLWNLPAILGAGATTGS